MSENKVYLALGSNLGDREKNLDEAIKGISNISQVNIICISKIYNTKPVGYTVQNDFLNMALALNVELKPLPLLEKLHEIENSLKRTRDIHWGPRTIDIDILLYGNEKIELPQLTVPHPRMLERAFVLIPFKDVYQGEYINGTSINELIMKCNDKDGVKPYKKGSC